VIFLVSKYSNMIGTPAAKNANKGLGVAVALEPLHDDTV